MSECGLKVVNKEGFADLIISKKDGNVNLIIKNNINGKILTVNFISKIEVYEYEDGKIRNFYYYYLRCIDILRIWYFIHEREIKKTAFLEKVINSNHTNLSTYDFEENHVKYLLNKISLLRWKFEHIKYKNNNNIKKICDSFIHEIIFKLTFSNGQSRFNELVKITDEKNYEVSKYYSNIWDYTCCGNDRFYHSTKVKCENNNRHNVTSKEYTKLTELIKQDINLIKHQILNKKNRLINNYEKLLQKINKNDVVISDNDNNDNVIFINSVNDITEDFPIYKLGRVYCKVWIKGDSEILLDTYNDNIRNLKCKHYKLKSEKHKNNISERLPSHNTDIRYYGMSKSHRRYIEPFRLRKQEYTEKRHRRYMMKEEVDNFKF